MTPKSRIQLRWRVKLDEYDGKNRAQMEKAGKIKEFWANKAKCMLWALEEQDDVMFLDGDQFVVSRIDGINYEKEMGLSPHFMPKRITDRYGYYNAGMIWTKSKQVIKRWIELIPGSRFVDQACVENLAKEFSYFEFGGEYNIQSYRFTQGLLPMNKYMQLFVPKQNKLMWNGKEVKTFHTHFRRGDPMTKVNQFIQGMLIRAKKWRESAIIDRMLNENWQLQIPVQPHPQKRFHHANDSFRQYPYMWKNEERDVQVIVTKRCNCWLGNSVMLYDRPTIEWMNDEGRMAACIMMGNGGYNEMEIIKRSYKTNVRPWIFWPRDITTYLNFRKVKSYENRKTQVVFIGNYENSIQQKYRQQGVNWSKFVDEYHLTSGKNHKFTKQQYVEKIGDAKFGLCLRGYGVKCHREVELMGLGTVPLITPDVEIESYLDPPKEDTHYIRVTKPEEIKEKIQKISKEKWEEMSSACVDWFNRQKSWNTTITGILYLTQ